MEYTSIYKESKSAPLYHAVKMQYAIDQLKTDKIQANTTQRFWADGKPRNDNDPDYYGSYWMIGLSTTRNIKYAESWSGIVYALDQSKLSHNYEIVPIDWGSIIGSRDWTSLKSRRRESEEFVVMKRFYESFESGKYHKFDIGKLNDYKEKVKPIQLSKYLLSFEIEEWLYDKYPKECQWMEKHPMFAGYFK